VSPRQLKDRKEEENDYKMNLFKTRKPAVVLQGVSMMPQ